MQEGLSTKFSRAPLSRRPAGDNSLAAHCVLARTCKDWREPGEEEPKHSTSAGCLTRNFLTLRLTGSVVTSSFRRVGGSMKMRRIRFWMCRMTRRDIKETETGRIMGNGLIIVCGARAARAG